MILSLSSHRVTDHSNLTGAELVSSASSSATGAASPGPARYDVVGHGARPARPDGRAREGALRPDLDEPEPAQVLRRPLHPRGAQRRGPWPIWPRPCSSPATGWASPTRSPAMPAACRTTRASRRPDPPEEGAGPVPRKPDGRDVHQPRIFRATVPVAGTAPVGNYEVACRCSRAASQLAREQTSFEVTKVGFEQAVTTSARQHPWLYGSPHRARRPHLRLGGHDHLPPGLRLAGRSAGGLAVNISD